MFDSEFFITPKSVIKKMLSRFKDISSMSILDPSAGKGDILDFIKDEYCRYGSDKLYCIERNLELQSILKDKNYKLLATDFLEYSSSHLFDLIIMNPPFSNGAEHLLHAWNVLHDGDIVCLLNKETYDNPYTKKRKLLQSIIDENGSVEYLGNCFDTAERKTDVDVILVHLEKEADDIFAFEFEEISKEKTYTLDEDIIGNPVALKDNIGNMVIEYEEAKRLMVDFVKMGNKIRYHSSHVITSEYSNFVEYMTKTTADLIGRTSDNKNVFNEFVERFKADCWNSVFQSVDFDKHMTSKVREDFEMFCKSQTVMDFTVENIENFLHTLIMNAGNIINQTIIEVFDECTKFDKKNKVHWEGWKTNDAWKVNGKVIIPYLIDWDSKWIPIKFHLSYSYKTRFLDDMDKVMTRLSGKKHETIRTMSDALKSKFDIIGSIGRESFDNTAESTFFSLRFYKKGTLHVKFKDERLWTKFNVTAAKLKGWEALPDDYNRREKN